MIGMLGGMSWKSSQEYYRLANTLVRKRRGGVHSARVLLISTSTMHVVYEQVAAAVSAPVLHLADATAARIHIEDAVERALA